MDCAASSRKPSPRRCPQTYDYLSEWPADDGDQPKQAEENGKLRNRFKETIAGLFGEADVLINGARPWDMAVHDDRFYQRVLADGIVGLG